MVKNTAQWSAIILAAGRSKRFGAAKVLQSFNGVPFVRRIRLGLQANGIHEITLVLGYQARVLMPQIPDAEQFNIIINENFADGQFASLQAGLQKVSPNLTGIILCLVDQPHIAPPTYARLLQAAKEAPHAFLIPQYANKGGHPVIIPADYFADILNADPKTCTLKDLMRKYETNIKRLPVQDPAVLEDIDTRAKLLELEEKYK